MTLGLIKRMPAQILYKILESEPAATIMLFEEKLFSFRKENVSYANQ